MALWVVKVLREGYKIRLFFCPKIKILQGNFVNRHGVESQKLNIILENKKYQK
jgi:hypothetical protein